jgi:hypothetical protein
MRGFNEKNNVRNGSKGGSTTMRKSLPVALVLAFYTLIHAGSLEGAKPAPTGCGSDDYTLIVDIYPSTADTTYNIASDQSLPYKTVSSRNNKSNVGFQIANCTYDLVIDLFQSARKINVSLPSGMTTSWFVNFDRIASVPLTDGTPEFQTWCQAPQQNPDGSFKTYVSGGKTIPFDSYAGCFSDAGGWYARRCVGFGLANNFNLRFQTSPFGGNTPLAAGTSYIKVYHPTANTWILEPEAPAQSVLFSDPQVATGYQPMPFKMAVTKP